MYEIESLKSKKIAELQEIAKNNRTELSLSSDIIVKAKRHQSFLVFNLGLPQISRHLGILVG